MTYFAAYSYDGDRTLVYDRSGDPMDFCTRIETVKTIKDIDTDTLYLEIAVRQVDGSDKYVLCTATDILERALHSLIDYGLLVSKVHEYVVTVTEILFEGAATAPCEHRYSKLGFRKVDGGCRFFGAEATINKQSCKYLYYDSLKPMGTFESWRDGILPLIFGNPKPILALAMGVTAPIVTMLEMAGIIDETAIFALIGGSSRSKTTMLKLSCSAWGKPSLKGALTSLSCSEAYFFSRLSEKNAFPHFVDEATAAKCSWDFSTAIYNIAMSVEAGKCFPDGTPRPKRTWSGSVIFTSEQSLLSRAGGNGGLYARLIEFDYIWLSDGKTADAIQRHIAKNHGTAYKYIIRHLAKLGKKRLVEAYERCASELKAHIQPSAGIEERIVKKLALLLLAAEVLTEAWSLEYDRNEYVLLLKDAFKQNAPESDRLMAWYEHLMTYIAEHRNLFPSKGTLDGSGEDTMPVKGVLELHNYRKCVWLTAELFAETLEACGLTDSKGTLDMMKNRNMIAYHSDRFKKKHSIGGIDILSVCIYLNLDPSIKEKATKKKPKSKLRQRSLLTDEESDNES